MNLKKVLCLIAVICIFAIMAVGCGNSNVSSSTSAASTTAALNAATTAAATTAPATPAIDKNYAVKIAISSDQVSNNITNSYVKSATDAGYKVEIVSISGTAQDYGNKVTVSLMAGDELDLIRSNTSSNFNFSRGKLILGLNDIAVKNGIDMESIYGMNLVKQDGVILGVPVTKDQWITLYNKKIFDDAKVPYPTADSWTWSKYIETAKKLTDPSKGIFGSYMLDYDSYNYMIAAQKKVPAYKADGTSNFDDPGYKDALKFFYDLGNVEKIQPDMLTFQSKKLQWDDFARGKYGMFVCGSWSTCLMSDPKNYPRDWKFGILPMPSVDGAPRTALSIIGQIAVASTTKHPNEAFLVANIIGSNFYKAATGDLYVNANLTDSEISDWTAKVSANFNGDVTTDEFNNAFKGIEPVSEKIIGNGSPAISQAFISEGEAYGEGQKQLDDAIKAIKQKADAAIAADK